MLLDKETGACVDDKDMLLFTPLCQFIWVQGDALPLIYDLKPEIYREQGIDLPLLKYLETVGLISLAAAGYVKKKLGKHTRLSYFGQPTKIQFPVDANNQLDLGHVLLTDKGKMLAGICDPKRNQAFYEYVIERWLRQGMAVSSILKRR
jgi:hypothetical protein